LPTSPRAKARPIKADEIAVHAMKEKNLGDGALRQNITRQFMWTLTRMLKTRTVTKQVGARMLGWGMPDGVWQPAGETLI
jgi:hypothetical protein